MLLYEDGKVSVMKRPIWKNNVVGKYFDESLKERLVE